MIIFLSFCVVSLLCLRWLFKFQKWKKMSANVPWVSGSLPIIGVTHKLFGDSTYLYYFINLLSNETNAKGGITKAWVGPSLFFVITDPEICHEVLDKCYQKNYFYKFTLSWLGNGLFTADAKLWKSHRSILNPSFNPQILEGFIEIFNKQSLNLVTKVSEYVGRGSFDPWNLLKFHFLQVSCQTIMGLPEDEKIVFNKYVKALEELLNISFYRVQRIWMHLDCIYNMTSLKVKENENTKVFKDTSFEILKKRRKELNKRKTKEEGNKTSRKIKLFIDVLLELAEDGHISDKEIEEEIGTMITAAFETSTLSMLYTLILLGTYEDVQEKVYKELQELFDGPSRNITKTDLSKLVYMEAVIKEMLRFHGIGPGLIRRVDTDIAFDDFTLPAGTNCIVIMSGTHKHKSWGPEADAFIPERWLEPNVNKEGFVAFASGRRSCIGQKYAIMSQKIALAHFLWKYKVKSDFTQVKYKLELVTKPVEGSFISIELR